MSGYRHKKRAMDQKFGGFPLLLTSPPRGQITLLICRIDLKKLQELGRKYVWKKPNRCPCCGSGRLWGHGFVLRCFHGFALKMPVKRYRCADCTAVHTLRPHSHSPGFHYSIAIQTKSISRKLQGKPFISSISRQVQQHWWKSVRYHLCRQSNWHGSPTLTDLFRDIGQTPATKRRIYHARPSGNWPPYLSFALTTKKFAYSLE